MSCSNDEEIKTTKKEPSKVGFQFSNFNFIIQIYINNCFIFRYFNDIILRSIVLL